MRHLKAAILIKNVLTISKSQLQKKFLKKWVTSISKLHSNTSMNTTGTVIAIFFSMLGELTSMDIFSETEIMSIFLFLVATESPASGTLVAPQSRLGLRRKCDNRVAVPWRETATEPKSNLVFYSPSFGLSNFKTSTVDSPSVIFITSLSIILKVA